MAAIDVAFLETVRNRLVELVSTRRSCREAQDLCERVIAALSNTALSSKKFHPKIIQVMEYLNQLPVKKSSIKEISDHVYLSESRLRCR